ncbi:MAG: hypothetical protein ACT4QE_18755 [Anaerolineales bacterium]
MKDERAWPVLAFILHLSSFILFALLVLGPLTLCPTCVPYPPGAQYSDLMITHLPNAEYWRTALTRYGQWPLWNAQLFGGQPFTGDPLAGIWYPPNLLLLILPLPLGFNVLFVLHLAWAGYGMSRFLRVLGLPFGPALFGGLVFAGTPKLIAHVGAGHVSLVFAVAWTPWLLLLIHSARYHEELRGSLWVGAVLGFIFLADPRWAFFAAALAFSYWLYRMAEQARMRAASSAKAHRRKHVLEELLDGARGWLGAVVFFTLIAAPLLVPMFEFVARTTRTALTVEEAGAYSLPPYYLLGLLIPNLRGFHEWMTYLGVLPLLLALLTLRRRFALWWGAVVIAVLFALGTNFILYPLLYRMLPGLSLLRVPARAWFIVAFGVSVLAAHGLQRLLEDGLPWLQTLRFRKWIPPARAEAMLPLEKRTASEPRNISCDLFRFLSRRSAAQATLIGIVALTALDLFRVDVTLVEAKPRPARNAAADWLAARAAGGGFRVYSPSYSLPPDEGLEHVDGVNPLQLAVAAKFIAAASGVPSAGYSVTLPAFASADLATANREAVPDAEMLGLLNVKYVAAEFDVTVPELKLVQTFGNTRVYENAAFRPRAWIESGGQAEVLEWTPNRITLRAEGSGLLVLSETHYPGWQVRVDGRPATIASAQGGLLRGVSLSGAGSHLVEFEYQPLSVMAGLALFIFGVTLLIDPWLWRQRM